MGKKKDIQPTIELSAIDIESVTEPTAPSTAPEPRQTLTKDADGRNVIDDPFARTIIDGRYEVMRCLGTGAMGSVFLVNHLRLGKLFALKMVNPELAGLPEFVARFEREANACSRLEHPNCITVTDFGHTSDGSLYLVMEYADGALLSELLAQGPVSLEEAMEYIRQVLLGLKHAHGEGLVHRDIKLENVVKCRREDGQTILKILDFGMAKTPLKDSRNVNITQDGVVMGTPQYMAPEQIRDDNVDGRADLYAVGVTFFRLLAGKPIFEGDNPMDVFASKLTKPVPTLGQLTGNTFPEAVEAFIAKALKNEADERFQSAEEMLDALDALEVTLNAPKQGRRLSLPAAQPIGRAVAWLRSVSAHFRTAAVAWYDCDGVTRPRGWRGRLLGLYTTHHGRMVSMGILAVVLLVTGIGVAIVPTEQTAGVTDGAKPTVAVAASGPSASKQAKENRGGEKARPPETVASEKNVPVSTAEKDNPSDAVETSSVEQEPSNTESLNPELIEAALLIEQRKCRKAEKLLNQLATDTARKAYLLGRSKACRGQNAKALVYYKEAVEKDGAYRADSRILLDVKEMLAGNKTRDDALAFMATGLGKPALPTLIQLAGHYPNKTVRHKALAIVSEQGAADHVDMTVALELDLNQAGTCKEKREIVQKLAELNTKAARGVLIRARDLQVKEGFFKTRYKHGCVRGVVIKALSEMKKKS